MVKVNTFKGFTRELAQAIWESTAKDILARRNIKAPFVVCRDRNGCIDYGYCLTQKFRYLVHRDHSVVRIPNEAQVVTPLVTR